MPANFDNMVALTYDWKKKKGKSSIIDTLGLKMNHSGKKRLISAAVSNLLKEIDRMSLQSLNYEIEFNQGKAPNLFVSMKKFGLYGVFERTNIRLNRLEVVKNMIRQNKIVLDGSYYIDSDFSLRVPRLNHHMCYMNVQ